MPRAVSAPSSRAAGGCAAAGGRRPARTRRRWKRWRRRSRSGPAARAACARSGGATAPMVPPSRHASWRQPDAMPRRSGGNWRSRLFMPAAGTTGEKRCRPGRWRRRTGRRWARPGAALCAGTDGRAHGTASRRSTTCACPPGTTTAGPTTAANTAPNPPQAPGRTCSGCPRRWRAGRTARPRPPPWAMTAMISVVPRHDTVTGARRMYARTGVGDRTHPLSDLRERATAGRDRRAGRRLGFRAARPVAVLRVRCGQAQCENFTSDDEMLSFWRESMAVARALSSCSSRGR